MQPIHQMQTFYGSLELQAQALQI